MIRGEKTKYVKIVYVKIVFTMIVASFNPSCPVHLRNLC